MIIRKLIIALIFILFFSIPAFGETLIINSEEQFAYAETCFDSGDYFRAIGEYKRFAHFFPNDEKKGMALYKIGVCHYKLKQYREGAVHLFKMSEEVSLTKSGLRLKHMNLLADCLEQYGARREAIAHLMASLLEVRDKEAQDEIHNKIGRIYLDWGKLPEANNWFGRVGKENQAKYGLEGISRKIEEADSIPQKSPVLAGILSVVPGGGYLYCGRKKDALISFLINGALIAAAVESFENGNEVLGGVISFVELGFYSGSIFGAVNSAHKYNRKKRRDFIEKIKDNGKIKLYGEEDGAGFRIAFTYSF